MLGKIRQKNLQNCRIGRMCNFVFVVGSLHNYNYAVCNFQAWKISQNYMQYLKSYEVSKFKFSVFKMVPFCKSGQNFNSAFHHFRTRSTFYHKATIRIWLHFDIKVNL